MYRKNEDQSSVRYTLVLMGEDLGKFGRFLAIRICPKCAGNITESLIDSSIGFYFHIFAAW